MAQSEKKRKNVNITIPMSQGMVDRIEELVESEDEFMNRSDAGRVAIWDLLRRYGHEGE